MDYGRALELCNNAYALKENHQHDCPQCRAVTQENQMCELGRILLHRWLNARMDVQALEPMTTCIDCRQPTTPGKGSARCPGCWEDRCGQ